MSAYAKAIVAFVALVVGDFLTNYVKDGNFVPQTASQWVIAVLTVFVGTGAVYGIPNGPSVVVK